MAKSKLPTRTTSLVIVPRTLRPPKYSASKGWSVVLAVVDVVELNLFLLRNFGKVVGLLKLNMH